MRFRRRPRRVLRAVVAAIAVAAVAAAVATVLVTQDGRRATSPPETTSAPESAKRHRPGVTRLVPAGTGALPAAVQDVAAAPLSATRAVAAGGLSVADVSTADVRVVSQHGGRTVARLPLALHDAAAASVGGHAYLLGGGDGTTQHDAILRIDPGAAPQAVGRLPAPSSDQAAAVVGGTVYVVGGYTGSAWLDTVVAWRPGATARVVGHLPAPLRYAAVTPAAGRVVIAGGSLPNGTASRAVYAFDPRTRRVAVAGRLPRATTHAAAATLGATAYVIGGRGTAADTPTAAIEAVDVLRRRVRPAGTLPTALSDAAAVALGHGVLVVGGRGIGGATDTLLRMRVARGAAPVRLRKTDVYAADGAGMLDGPAQHALQRVYVPNSRSNTVDVIDPHTFRVVRHFAVGELPQHVTPSWDLRWLYVLNDLGNTLTRIDPDTARPDRTIRVADPYNLYFTPDGRSAIVVAERLHRLDFRNPRTFALQRSVDVPCAGVDHMDFSADGTRAVASCEFSGQLVEVDVEHPHVLRTLLLPDGPSAMPQDVKLSPDGRTFWVADMTAGGLWRIDARSFRVRGFVRTGRGVHGLYPSRDARLLYASNRSEGSISVISFRTGKVLRKWWIPGGGSPDMGGVSADGKVLWLSGRYNAVVYAISTRTGKLLARIPVGNGPHGVCVWPQPGRHSLGHTGILR
ncbi:MAG TPA: YncE family protein [Gaiellaceae bacterium]|nr:YncE family protein [Gaiellaceae bacterium]